jgi:hypothetical protein
VRRGDRHPERTRRRSGRARRNVAIDRELLAEHAAAVDRHLRRVTEHLPRHDGNLNKLPLDDPFESDDKYAEFLTDLYASLCRVVSVAVRARVRAINYGTPRPLIKR